MIFAATGHRPDKLGGYGPEVSARLTRFAEAYLDLFFRPSSVITGMALGWDTAWAQAAARLRIPFIAAVPFEGQECRWPLGSQQLYRALLEKAKEVVVVSPGGYDPAKMQIRNQWMVDHADLVVALWNGSSGGTANCVRYAESQGKPIDNVWSAWSSGMQVSAR